MPVVATTRSSCRGCRTDSVPGALGHREHMLIHRLEESR